LLRRIRRAKPSPALAVSVVALVIACSGTAVAASGWITGSDVKNGSLTGADVKTNSITGADIANGSVRGYEIKNGSLNLVDLSERARRGLQGQQGPKGDPGEALAAERLTAVNTTYSKDQHEVRVVDVPALAASSDGPSATEGAALFDPVKLDEGTYKIEGTVQFFDFTPDSDGVEYGVARTFLGDQLVGTMWTPDVPDDGSNAAQANGSSIVHVPAGGATLAVRAAMRSTEGADGGQAGGNLIVTKLAGA
jgi:hypothetical protein